MGSLVFPERRNGGSTTSGQPLKQHPLSRLLLGVLEPSWSRLIGRRGAPPQGGRATSEPVVLHFRDLPTVGGPQGATGTTTPRRLCAEGVIITEDAGGGASWDEAGARSTGTSVAAAGNGRVFLARDRRSDPGSWRFPVPGSRALPPAVVVAAGRRSPALIGRGDGSGRGHHESGVPPGRCWAGGGGRGATACHPELPLKSRQDAGKPEDQAGDGSRRRRRREDEVQVRVASQGLRTTAASAGKRLL